MKVDKFRVVCFLRIRQGMRAFAALLAVVLAALTDGSTTQRPPAQPQLTVEIQSPLAGAWFAAGESSSIPVRRAAVRAALRVSVRGAGV